MLRVFDRDVPQEEHDAAYGASFSILAGDSGTAARVCECLPRLGPEGMSQALYLLWIAYRKGNAHAEKCVVTALLGGDKQLQMRVLHALALAPAGRTDWSEVVGQVAKGDQDPEVRRLAEQIGRHHR